MKDRGRAAPKPSAVIVDDESLAREHLRDLVRRIPLVEVVGEAGDGATAIRLIDELEPDLVFLDIEIPSPSGLEVLRRVRHRPTVIFTTAFSDYAVTAFELAAVDYLLKPFGLERLRTALERAVADLAGDGAAPAAIERTQEVLGAGPLLRRLFVREAERIIPLPVEDILRIQGHDDYSAVHGRERMYRVRMRLRDLERRLDPQRFIRVHRSHIVNLDQVKTFQPYDARRLLIELYDGTRIIASRSGSLQIRALIR